mgnify:CR=1 FL=1
MYFDYIQTALEGAKYHEDQAFLLAHPKNPQYKKVVFHLRAYFWELWSVWDYVLQHANSQTLKLEPHQVRRKFLERLEEDSLSYQYLSQLKSLQSHDRLLRIMWLRDHAHKWQLDPYLVDYHGEVVNVIAINNLDGKDKVLPRQINVDRNDLSFMADFVKELTDNGFFNPVVAKNT